ncbi:Aldose 1-/Glucose-6-phosphate 1-epimerase [Dillenia turbinata]|uniref:Aldose 1-epimerase n=1 Tax=Dillenia turbinata TaxID=194707 RepID=A0AAN8V506_9MAGN
MAKISFLLLCLVISTTLFTSGVKKCEARIEVRVFELKKGDLSVKITNWGATVLSVILPDKNGKLDDNDTTYFGAIVGRVANRIEGAQFTLNGKHYKLVANEGKNTLHSGHRGFSDVIWRMEDYKKAGHLTLTYDSFNGEQGFPGDVKVSVTYMLLDSKRFAIRMHAIPKNQPTPLNLASHTYWNLGGHTSGNILSHNLQLFATKYTPVDDELIPTGDIVPVDDTPYDFREPNTIGSRILELSDGYDINYVLDNRDDGKLSRVATVRETKSGRKMELWSNQPGVQFYTGNKLDHTKGKGGFFYQKHAAFCLETQGFPDSVNHPNFPSQIVNPGDAYTHVMVYRFTTSHY